MASRGTLPLYYKNSKPTSGLSGPAKSWKDNYLLVVVFVGFIILIAGTFWFLPPMGDKDADYEKTYGRFTGNPAAYMTDPVIPSEPTLEPPEATVKSVNAQETHAGGGEEAREPANGREPEGGEEAVKGEMLERGNEKDSEVRKNSQVPVKLEDIIAKENDVKRPQLFEKAKSEPPTVANVVADTAVKKEPAVVPVSRQTDDIVAEERRKKVVEVRERVGGWGRWWAGGEVRERVGG